MTFFYWFTARSARDAKTAELNIITFAVERTAKEMNSIYFYKLYALKFVIIS